MAQGRCEGAKIAKGKIFIHLDSDMILTQGLIDNIVKCMKNYDALTIREQSIGKGFWSKCKAFEKSLYENIDEIESARVIRADWYRKLNGHDPKLVFSEDKDLDIRLRRSGARVGRSEKYIIHDEGRVTLSQLYNKKKRYGGSLALFAKKHPKESSQQLSLIFRAKLVSRNWKKILLHPALFMGFIIIKLVEYKGVLEGGKEYYNGNS
jgi:arabinofuranan 3-O-arabinosyltransferase